MSTTTIDDILTEVDKLDAEATGGTWNVHRFDNDGGEINWQVQSAEAPYEVLANVDDGEVRRARATATFIARARTLLPLLAAEVRKLQSAKAVCATRRDAWLALTDSQKLARVGAAWARRGDVPDNMISNPCSTCGAKAGRPCCADLVREMIDRLTRDAEGFRQTRHVSVSDARIRADACRTHSEALAKLLTMARNLADAGHHDRAVALLRGDMPAPRETP